MLSAVRLTQDRIAQTVMNKELKTGRSDARRSQIKSGQNRKRPPPMKSFRQTHLTLDAVRLNQDRIEKDRHQ